MVFAVTPLAVLRKVFFLNTRNQFSVAPVNYHVRSDGDILNDVAHVKNTRLVFVRVHRNFYSACLNRAYRTDTKQGNAIPFCHCHLVTFSRSEAIVLRSRFASFPSSFFSAVTVTMFLLGRFSNSDLHSFVNVARICDSASLL